MKMKKSIVFLFIAGIFLNSCTKEVDYKSTTQYNEVIDSQRVLSITSTFSDVKTTYDGEKTFKWIEGDKIGVYMTLGETSGIYQFTAESTGASVKFIHVLTDEEQSALGGGEPVYGTHAYYPYNGGDASITVGGTDANPTVSLAGTITQPTTNPMSIIPMVGKNNGSGTYSFVAITGVLKMTISDMPELVQKVHLLANGQAFNGVFNLQEASSDLYVDLSHFQPGYGWVDKQIVFTPTNDGDNHDDPVSTGDTRVFYFPIPEGTIQSGMTVQLKNSSNEVLMSRVTNKPITINRNRITPLETFTTWKSLGTGKFRDSRTFTEAGNAAEYVDVEIQQSRIYPNRFRLVNPYGSAWSHFSYTWTEIWTPEGPSDFLSFYLLSQGEKYPNSNATAVSDGKVYFYPHFTGSKSATTHSIYGEGRVTTEIRLTHSNFHNDAYLADSQVYKYQDSGLPANVSLHPRYAYRKSGLGGEYVEDSNILIAFPNCDELEYGDYSVAVSAGGTSDAITATLTLGAAVSKVKVVLADSESAGITLIDAGNAAVQTFTANGTSLVLNGVNVAHSGLCHIVACTYDASDNRMMTSCIPVYYLTDSDKNKFCKQHTDGRDTYYNNTSLTGMTITFAPSDTPSSSNIMLTEFDGMSYNAAPPSKARFYDRMNIAEGQSFVNGSPLKGVYDSSLGYNSLNCRIVAPYNGTFFTYNGQRYTLQGNSYTSGFLYFCLNRYYDTDGERYYIRFWYNDIYLRRPGVQSDLYTKGGFRAYEWAIWKED